MTQAALEGFDHKEGTFLPVGEVARLFGVDERSVQYWEERGWFPQQKRGLYRLEDVVPGVYKSQLEIINKKMGEEGSKKQKLELQRLEEQVRSLQIENDKLTGNLRDVSKVARVAHSRGKMEGDMLDSLPARLKPILAAEIDEFTVGQILKTEIDRIRHKTIEINAAQW
ncbi:MAG: MerR family transcriptional regulator [Syntrophales bacterium LBB04]|nr:MerR family transcriptional regulator [Syntrophales bacterium LBB04]